MSPDPHPVTGVTAGVPFLAVPPVHPRDGAPLVVAWHLLDAPRTEAAFAAALPLRGLDAWRVYLGLPLCGARLPAGGAEELMRRAFAEAALQVHGPICEQAAAEFPAALAELQDRLPLPTDGVLGLVGGSLGAAVAQLVLVDTAPAAGLAVQAAVLISPVTRLHAVVDAVGRRYGLDYAWSAAAREVAARLDFVARAGETAEAGRPAVRLIVGADDDRDGFLHPAEQLRAALADAYGDPSGVDLVVVPGMAHALAEEPGTEPAAQTPHAAAVDRLAADWFSAHLPGL